MSKPEFGYFTPRGIVNPVLHLLHFIDLDHEEKRYALSQPPATKQEWLKVKYTLGLDFPNMPYWIEPDTGIKLTELKAILKHIAREHAPELLPKTNAEEREADMLDSLLVDIQWKLIYLAYDYTDVKAATVEETAVDKFNQLTKFLTGRKWLLGQKLSYVDFLLYDVLYVYNAYNSTLLELFPALLTYMKSFESIPSIAKYMASPKYVKGPCVAPYAMKPF